MDTIITPLAAWSPSVMLSVAKALHHRPAARLAVDAAWTRTLAVSNSNDVSRVVAAPRQRKRAAPVQASAAQPPQEHLIERRADGSIVLPDGFLLVDKPIDWTSFDVVGKIRNTLERFYKKAGHRFGRRSRLKVGHGGTLDPMATGLLVLGVGKGTKGLQFYSSGSKSYVARAQLGSETDTQD